MPCRNVELASGHYYHVFNRSIPGLECFIDDRAYKHFIEAVWYYNVIKTPLRFTKYLHSSWDKRRQWKDEWQQLPHRVKIIAYCLMPNHYHFLLEQCDDNGISSFLRLLQNSFSHYYNTRKKRSGPVFTGRFKAVLIDSNTHLLHVSRYIHLNPVTAYIVKSVNQLDTYQWSSWNEYHGKIVEQPITHPQIVLNQFSKIIMYEQFCRSAVDYERELKDMHKLMLDAQDAHTRCVHLKTACS